LAQQFGFELLFFGTGVLMLLATLLILKFVKEKTATAAETSSSAATPSLAIKDMLRIPGIRQLYMVSLISHLAILALLPVITVYVQILSDDQANLILLAGLIGSVSGVANMLAAPISGWIGDRIGHERVMVISLIGSVVTLIPQGMVTELWQFFVLRFLFGLTMGGLFPAHYALIREAIPATLASRAFSLNTSFQSLGSFIGPIVGGWLAGMIGMRPMFIFAGVFVGFSIVWYKKWRLTENEST
jgi:DHA1 family multidrug resistance protein-like MFS transporter